MGLEKNSHVVRVGGEAVGGFHFCLVSEGRKKAFPFGTLRPPSARPGSDWTSWWGRAVGGASALPPCARFLVLSRRDRAGGPGGVDGRIGLFGINTSWRWVRVGLAGLFGLTGPCSNFFFWIKTWG
jgi:hypothetical protein